MTVSVFTIATVPGVGVPRAAGGRPLGPGPWLLPPRARGGSGVRAGRRRPPPLQFPLDGGPQLPVHRQLRGPDPPGPLLRALPAPGGSAAPAIPGTASTRRSARTDAATAARTPRFEAALSASLGVTFTVRPDPRRRWLRQHPGCRPRRTCLIWRNGPWRLWPPAVPPGRCGTYGPRSSACSAPTWLSCRRTGTGSWPTRSPRSPSPPPATCPWRHRRCSTSRLN